jgi:macrolide transport system ATP-binding/permease protein
MSRLWRKLMFLIRRERFDRDLEDEMRFHLEMKARVGGGTAEAGYAAQRQFGNATLLREQSREIWGWGSLDRLAQDLRYGVRMLGNNPSFTLIAVLTLAVGIGVNTAIFTAFNAVALRLLDVPEPERVVQVTGGAHHDDFSYPDYIYLRDNSREFASLTALSSFNFSMRGVPALNTKRERGIGGAAGFNLPEPILGKNAERVFGLLVAGNYLRVLGVAPVLGRDFIVGEDDKQGAHPVLMLSENFWELRFARDPSVLGRTLIMNDVAFTVIGITPHDFAGTTPLVPSVWAALAIRDRLEPGTDLLHDRHSACCALFARLAPGVTQKQAQAQTDGLFQRVKNLYPDEGARSKQSGDHIGLMVASPFGRTEGLGTPTALVLAAVSLVLLIACANVASLLLARSTARQKEIAIRLAIGASRGRLIRQLMTESALISILAGGTGLVLAWWVLHLLMVQISESLSIFWVTIALHLAPDHRVFAYMLLVSLVAAIGFGLVPALQASKPNLTSALKEEGGSIGGLRKSGLRDLLVGVQVAVSLVLLIGAGLLARGSQRAFGIDLGFDYRKLIEFHFVMSAGKQDPAKARAIQRQVIARAEAIAGIRSVSVASRAPLMAGNPSIAVALDGRPLDPEHALESTYTLVSPNYFETLNIPIVRGRGFTEQDTRGDDNFNGVPVIVSENTARRFWPGQNPIGKRIGFETSAGNSFSDELHPRSRSSMVIGIARDIRSVSVDKFDDTCLYIPVTRDFVGHILIRTAGDPLPAVAALHRELPAVDPSLEAFVFDFRSMLSFQPSFFFSHIASILAAIVGVLGLVLASVGIYGMVSFAVSQRTHEVGIRMALGARREDVLKLVLGQSMRPVLIGIGVGIVAAAGAARVLVSLLFGLSTFDPPTFLGVSAILAAVALVAGYIPARRAMEVDPMVVLGYE